jgi:LysM repeat protein
VSGPSKPVAWFVLAVAVSLSAAPRVRAERLAGAVASRASLLEQPEAAVGPTYEVQAGDTLGAIALRLKLATQELLRLNPGLAPDRIREGQALRLAEAGRRVDHVVQSGERLARLAARYEVSVAELRRWNPGLEPDRLRVGRALIVYTRVPESRSRSVGTPAAGQLLFAAQLPEHPGYLLRNPERAWGTHETIAHIVDAFDALRRHEPLAPRVRVHDLSLREGGPIDDHHSHQSGRDVDLTYFRTQCGQACPLRRVAPSELDVDRQWALLEHWLSRGQAEAIFVDYGLQARLYAHARAKGVSRELLQHWLQYPRGRGAPTGIVRHVPNHADHLHVRFVCHETDAECRMYRVSPVQASLATR